MFLNDLSISFVSFLGIVFLVVAVTFSRSVRAFAAQLPSRRKKRYSTSDTSIRPTHSHITIQVNPVAQLNNHRQRIAAMPLDDDDNDDELILCDVASISALNFGENNAIELRLDQDPDYDGDLDNEPDH